MVDEFGDRMKMHESSETARRFLPGLPVYARLDGRSFSKFTKGMDRPYDMRMIMAMNETTKYLVQETNACIGYTQSDEISLCWLAETPESQIFFDGKIQKMVSVLAAMATAKFSDGGRKLWPERFENTLPVFDARVFQLPHNEECANAFLWREFDATKNSISMAARSVYSHNDLMNKNGDQMKEMLLEKGIDWNDYGSYFKRGSFFQRKAKWIHLDAELLAMIPEDRRPDGPVQRHEIVDLNMPPFVEVRNRVEVIFDKADPITEGDE